MKSTFAKKISKSTMAMVCALLFIPTLVFAFGQGGGHGKGFGMKGPGKGGGICGIWRNAEMVKELGLTDAQVDQLKEADFVADSLGKLSFGNLGMQVT